MSERYRFVSWFNKATYTLSCIVVEILLPVLASGYVAWYVLKAFLGG
jgi:hypothetical protein